MIVTPPTVGRYQVERLIAHGGMGSVYLARDPAIDRQVVIKLLKEGFDDAAARERFTREARSAGRLQHPNIVTVFDVGEHADRPFIAMEYVEGETLGQLIKRGAPIPGWEKLVILEDVCAGLHYAHGVGVIHRDIKPANVMRLPSGMAKILDFGVARAGAGPITRAGDVVGTLNYMSPEQLAGEPVDHRTDVYAVGVLAYELFTHRMAFPGTIDTGVLQRILSAHVVPIEDLVPRIDPDIAAMVGRAMARDVDTRYQHLEDMREDIAEVRARVVATPPDVEEPIDTKAETRVDSSRVTSGLRPPSRRSSTVGRTPSSALPPADQVASDRSRSTTLLLAVACAALAGALVATVIFNRPTPGSPSVQADPMPQEPPRAQQPAPVMPPTAASERTLGGATTAPPAKPLSVERETPTRPIEAGKQRAPADAPARDREREAKSGTPQPTRDLAAPPSSMPPVPAPAAVAPAVTNPAASPQPVPPAPTPPVAEPPPAPPEPSPDPRASDQAAIRDALRRYAVAYQSLSSADVGRALPSLSTEQLRSLARDFSNYRRYAVDIRDERIAVDGGTATVTCQIVRSFETKSGVTGSNIVASVFHLRRNGSIWTIERLESR